MCFVFKNMLTIRMQATEILEVPNETVNIKQIKTMQIILCYYKQTDALEGNEQWGKAVMLKAAKQDIRKEH